MKKIIPLLAFFLFLSAFAYADWTTLGGDNSRSGTVETFVPDYSAATGYDSTGLVTTATLSLTSTGGEGTPVIVGDALYVPTFNSLIAFNTTRRSVLWRQPIVANTYSTPTINGTSICYGENDRLTCRNRNTGALMWSYTESGIRFETSDPTIVDGIVWSGSTGRGAHPALYSFDLNTGARRSRLPAPILIANGNYQLVNSPTVSEGIVYFTTIDHNGVNGALHAVNATDGTTQIWQYAVSPEGGSFWYVTPSISNNRIFIAVQGNDFDLSRYPAYVAALNKNDGSLLWRYNITDSGFILERTTPVIYAGKIFVAATDRSNTYVYSLNETTGSLMWQSALLPADIWTSPSVSDSKVILGTSNTLYSFNSNTGATQWSQALSNGFYGIVSLSNNTIYALDEAGVARSYTASTSYTEPSRNYPRSTTTIDARRRADTELLVTMSSPATGVITISKHLDESGLIGTSSPTVAGSFGTTQLRKFIDITADSAIKNNLVSAVIRIYYTDDEVRAAGLRESQLAIYDWNTTTRAWQQLANSGVDTVNNFVYGTTTHFSAFGSGAVFEDTDNDDAPDKTDNCILSPNPDQADTDKDGIGDSCDNCADVKNGLQLDLDSDGEGDLCDPDIDNDRKRNERDLCQYIPFESSADSDEDGVGDDCDNCITVHSSDQTDTDNDGLGNACDPDDDNDGGLDEIDNCPLLPSYSEPGSFIPLSDSDSDGLGNECDVCPDENPGAADSDGDGCADATIDGMITLANSLPSLSKGWRNALTQRLTAINRMPSERQSTQLDLLTSWIRTTYRANPRNASPDDYQALLDYAGRIEF